MNTREATELLDKLANELHSMGKFTFFMTGLVRVDDVGKNLGYCHAQARTHSEIADVLSMILGWIMADTAFSESPPEFQARIRAAAKIFPNRGQRSGHYGGSVN
jgi:hypothetical protein